MQVRNVWIVIMLIRVSVCASAQWLNYPTSGTPRSKDGKPILSAPAPRRGGKPDLAGIWQVESSSRKELAPYLLPGGENGLGESDPSKYFINFFADFPFSQEPFQPAAAALFRERMQSHQKPPTLCPPQSIPTADVLPVPFKLVQTSGLIVMLYEDFGNFRQIFTDGRKLPSDPEPGWFGYSVGKWDGDWLVIDTVGLNDKGVLDAMGHFHSESLRLTERLHRRDFGHMDIEITVDDPKTYTKPVTIKVSHRLLPDTDLLESTCSDGEKDLAHMPGK
jgi:hypothetical protein